MLAAYQGELDLAAMGHGSISVCSFASVSFFVDAEIRLNTDLSFRQYKAEAMQPMKDPR
jgi:hypothetical protein